MEIFKCSYCETVSNSKKGLNIHLSKVHNLNREEMYELYNGKQNKNCEVCSVELKFKSMELGWGKLCCKCSRRKSYRDKGITAWNKGLSKETDARVNKASQTMKEHYAVNGHHSTGKTKDNCQKVRDKAEKISKRLKNFYIVNEHWTKGQTAETNEAIRRRSISSGNAQRGKCVTESHRQAMSIAKVLPREEVEERLLAKEFNLVGEYLGNDVKTEMTCLQCGNTSKKSFHSVMYGSRCHTCFPPWQAGASTWQKEIADYIKTLGYHVILDDRSVLNGKEIDIYMPSENFGIECDGLYWHSMASGRCTPEKQEYKRQLAVSKNVNLMFLFQDEWEKKQEIVKSMISIKLHSKDVKKINGRVCKVRVCNVSELSTYMRETHIEGHDESADFGVVLEHGKQIVGACLVKRLATTEDVKLEITRMSFALMTHVPGGVSRLIKNVMKVNQAIVNVFSQIDSRLGDFSYKQFMNLVDILQPRVWWTDFSERYESENATEKEVHKIYGSASLVFSVKKL